MPSQNDFSIVSCLTYNGNEETTVITGNGLTSFEASALATIESLIQHAGFPNYALNSIDTNVGFLENSALFHDSAGTQTTVPSAAVLLQFLLRDDAYDIADVANPTITSTANGLDFITALAPRAFSQFSKAAAIVDSVADESACDETGSGRFESCRDHCTYKISVNVF